MANEEKTQSREEYRISRQQFYMLWVKCQGTSSYDKESWKLIEHQLIENGLMDKD